MDTKQKSRLAQLNTKRISIGLTPEEIREYRNLKEAEGKDQGADDITK